MLRRASFLLILIAIGIFGESAVAETKDECIQRLQEMLMSCYASCSDNSNEAECRGACRRHFQEQLSSCSAK
jgi:hypothetical protein